MNVHVCMRCVVVCVHACVCVFVCMCECNVCACLSACALCRRCSLSDDWLCVRMCENVCQCCFNNVA